MRRPLIQPDGTPLFQAAAGILNLFDTKDLDPDQTYAVTVFAWFPKASASNLAIGVTTNGVIVPHGIWLTTGNQDGFRKNGVGPMKVMDRYVIRGDQQITVADFGIYGSAGVTWYGYIERAGASEVPGRYRPLQPGLLVAPFNADPVFIVIPLNAAPPTVTQTIHMLDGTDERRIDYLTLDIACVTDAAFGALPTCTVKMPGGVNIPIPVEVDTATDAGSPIRLFADIPLRAPTQADNLVQIEVLGDTAGNVTCTASGRFTRV